MNLHTVDFILILLFVCNSVEYNNSYLYHAMFAYFDRDNIALKGLAKYVANIQKYSLFIFYS